MKVNVDCVGVVASDVHDTIQFYTLLGMQFESITKDNPHYEYTTLNGLRFMIDVLESGQQKPTPASHSVFGIVYNSRLELDDTITKILSIYPNCLVMNAQDMPWGQYYATIKDPNENKIDLFYNIIPAGVV
jgi:predicted enzyme related to lactoylglutathione lyase